jgi:adenosylmethionine-8-amino-7-oxononanoate aminotransferase
MTGFGKTGKTTMDYVDALPDMMCLSKALLAERYQWRLPLYQRNI